MIKTEEITVDCPVRGCKKTLIAEVNADFDNMTERQADNLKAAVRKRLLPGFKKHHYDGHPK